MKVRSDVHSMRTPTQNPAGREVVAGQVDNRGRGARIRTGDLLLPKPSSIIRDTPQVRTSQPFRLIPTNLTTRRMSRLSAKSSLRCSLSPLPGGNARRAA